MSTVQWRAEGFGCPGSTRFLDAHQKKYLRTKSCRKFLTTFFSHFPKFYNFTKIFPVTSANYLPKILTTFFYIVISPNFYFFFRKIFPDAPPLILDARGRSSLLTYLPLLFRHLPMHFLIKLRRWMPPGPSHPAPPSARHWHCFTHKGRKTYQASNELKMISL